MHPGDFIGPYRVLSTLGEGGMGIVYEAEQKEPVRRRVALKVIRRGLNTKEVIARFEAERQAYAMMDHPGIARVYDGGETEDGLPYFVMELVAGKPLVDFCAEHRLTLVQRLTLFLDICESIQHAHQRGIIHRDLKPSNVLVSENESGFQVKVIDFGIAKASAAGQKLTDRTLFTGFMQVLGTPSHMSPEQADISSMDIDTRTDVYTLGVLLYELVTGHLPFAQSRFENTTFSEIERILWEEDPPSPSKRLKGLGQTAWQEIASERQTTPKKLLSDVSGELDWIIDKAMEKERVRRYDSVSAFAQDIQHHLAHRPVAASPQTGAYQIRKFARRHRTGLAISGAFVSLLILATFVSTWQAVRARKAEATAERESVEAKRQAIINQRTLDFITGDLLESAGAFKEPDRDLKVRTLLDRTSPNIDQTFGEEPEIQVNLHLILGKLYYDLGDYHQARSHFQTAVTVSERVYGETGHVSIAQSKVMMARLCLATQDNEEGATHAREALAEALKWHPDDSAEMVRFQLYHGYGMAQQGKHEEAVPILMHCLDLAERHLGPSHITTVNANARLATSLKAMGDEERYQHYQALATERQQAIESGDQAFHQLIAERDDASLLLNEGKFEEAIPILKHRRESIQETLGGDHLLMLQTTNNLASAYLTLERYAEAYPHYKYNLEHYRKTLGIQNEGYLATLPLFAYTCMKMERFDESIDAFEECVNLFKARGDLKSPAFVNPYKHLMKLLDHLELDGKRASINGFLSNDVTWPPSRTVVLIEKGSQWSYSDQLTRLSDLAQRSEGKAPLGYGDDDLQTVISYGNDSENKHPRVWFRREFSIADAASFKYLKLRLRYDDRAIVHLNGHEVHADEPERNANLMTEFFYFVTVIDASMLVEGTNLIEVTILQASPDSSDLIFDLQLEGLKSAAR